MFDLIEDPLRRFAARALTTTVTLFLLVVMFRLFVGSSYCYSQGKRLTDEDFLNKAVILELQRHAFSDLGGLAYKTASDMRTAIPNCCTIQYKGVYDEEMRMSHSLFGFYATGVEIEYPIKQTYKGRAAVFNSSYTLGRCGEEIFYGGIILPAPTKDDGK